ncbi:MAG TPA: nicotinate (nicotinamide) nucleotide adenylyltransferase [Bacteroidia bacterium]|jgi:nicotinate-nucleotide adenylyltransferase
MKIGLFFGSFNPIHKGHLAVAGYMLKHTGLDRVWFVVSPQNPFKKKEDLLSDKERLKLVRMAIKGKKKLRASDVEFGLPQPSFTINTLTALRKKFPTYEFSIIMGTDNLQGFGKWKAHGKILRVHRIYVYPRAGGHAGKWADHPHVIITRAPLMECSATSIREMIKQGKMSGKFIPPSVAAYIRKKGFYRG